MVKTQSNFSKGTINYIKHQNYKKRMDTIPQGNSQPQDAFTEEPVEPQQYIAKSQSQEELKNTKWAQFKEFLVECKRVLRITKKPTRDEFQTIMKVSGLGMLVMGVIGFLVGLIRELLV